MESRDHASDKVRRSKLNLIDLAGSERIGKTNSTGSILREAKYINSSLFYLEVVITALHERATVGRAHIPYRNSLMTSVLRDSLGGNCKTTMIATISPDAPHTDESLSTCRFAQRVSQIKNKVSVNEELDPTLMIRRLKNEVLTLREEIAFLKGENDDESVELSQLMIEELKKKIRDYCDEKDMNKTLNIGKLTLTNIKTSFSIFKSYVLQAESSSSSNNNNRNDLDTPDEESKGDNKIKGNNNNNKNRFLSSSKTNSNDNDQIKMITELRECLLQREHEIAILVNMVKQGKTANDVMNMTNTNDNNDTSMEEEQKSKEFYNNNNNNNRNSFDNSQRLDSSSSHGNRSNNRDNTDNSYEARAAERQRIFEIEEKRRKQKEIEKEEKILKTRLFGVPPPSTQDIFDDSGASFEWFQHRCTMKKAIDENMEVLKDSIQDAKSTGEKANKSRFVLLLLLFGLLLYYYYYVIIIIWIIITITVNIIRIIIS